MAIDTVAACVDAVRTHRLLEPEQLSELGALQPRFAEPRALARHLIQKGWLTPYQLNQIFQGQAATLALGQYRLLERVGEGGMGQVFKARHHALGRVVALKVIRKERLANADVIKRFQREIQAASQLSHPNVVMAYDANAVGATHYLAMEFVDGIDLSQLCRQRGPLPVAEACDFIRQAALGLQYAHEQGMVHRDIKPSNLLLTTVKENGVERPVVKILDMGLARLQPHEQGDTGNSLSQDGSVMGTPDFMAPEQAKNSHQVDRRADIYGLGCTFYYLLTNRPPFAGTSHLEKLLKHQMDPAPDVGQLRPDVPDGVRYFMLRMLAKRPEDRPQTAGEVAVALASIGELPATARSVVPPIAHPSMRTTDIHVSTPEVRLPTRTLPRPRRRPSLALAAAALGLLIAGVAVLAWAVSGSGKPTTAPVVAAVTGRTLPGTTRAAAPPTERVVPPAEIPLHRYLPDDTKAVLTLRLPEIQQSPLYKRFSDRFDPLTRDLGKILQTLGIDATRDIQRVTVASAKAEPNYVLFQGSFSSDKVREALQRLKGKVKSVGAPPGQIYYEFIDSAKGEPWYAAVLGPGALAVSATDANLANVLERFNSSKRGDFKDPEFTRQLDHAEPAAAVRLLVSGGFVFNDQGIALDKAIPGLKNAAGALLLRGEGAECRLVYHFKDAAAARDFEMIFKVFLDELGKKKEFIPVARSFAKVETKVIEERSTLAVQYLVGPRLVDILLPKR